MRESINSIPRRKNPVFTVCDFRRNHIMPSQKLKKFYIWGIKTFIFLIPLLPLYISPSMVFEYVTGRNFAFRIITEFGIILWLGLIVLSKEYRPKSSPIFLSILIFTFIVGLADMFGVNPYNSFWSNYERMEGYITILHLAFYFMLMKGILRTQKDWTIFLNIFLLTGTIASLYIIFETLDDSKIYRLQLYSIIGHPTLLASYLLLIVFVGLILFFSARNHYLRYYYFPCVILTIMAIYFTATRGTVLALVSGGIFLSLLYIYAIRKTDVSIQRLYKKVAMVAVIISVLIPVVLWKFYVPEITEQASISKNIIPRFAIALSDPSVIFRVKAWNVAWEGIKRRPILGWGQENFISVYTMKPVPYGETTWMDRPHNIILEWLINAGILGLLSYLTIFGSALYAIRRAFCKSMISKSEAFILVTALFAYLIQNLFIFDTINTYLVFFALLAYIDNITHRNRMSSAAISANTIKSYVMRSIVVSVFAFLVLSCAGYFMHYKPIREAQLTKRILLSLREYKSFLPLLGDIKEALALNTFGDVHVRMIMESFADEILKRKLFKLEGAVEFVKTTSEELERLVATNHYNPMYWRYLINIYNGMGAYEPTYINRAEILIKKFMQLSPDNQWSYLALADNYALRGDYESALKAVEKAVALDPENDAVQLRLALAGILTSRDKVLKRGLENVKRIRISKDKDIAMGKKPVLSVDELFLLAQASKGVGNFYQAIEFYKEIITLSPDEARYHYELAELYGKIGDAVNATKEAEKAASLESQSIVKK